MFEVFDSCDFEKGYGVIFWMVGLCVSSGWYWGNYGVRFVLDGVLMRKCLVFRVVM